MKNLLKIFIIVLFMSFISGCGEIPESAREEEKNYKQMLEKAFDGIEYNIISEKTVQEIFIYEFKDNEFDVHIIDAELKDDPNFKFRICTGFSEVPTFKIVYDYATNYRNIRIHNDYVTNFQNAKHITLNNETYTRTPYSEECAINYYKNALIFDENSSVEEIAQELVSYDGISETTHFEYGNVVDACLSIDKENTYEHYVWAINNIIEDYNADGQVGFCR